MKFAKISSLFALSLIFISCEKVSDKDIESVGYGSSFGMCIDYCKTSLSVSGEKLVFSKSKNGNSPETKTCTSAISVAEVNVIKKLVDGSKVAALPETIGCPDCADGGAEWISVTANGKLQKVVFEYGKAPKELADAVVKLRALTEKFKSCN